MPRNELGKIRRSSVLSMFGPGAIVDFRAGEKGGAAVSVITAGLDDWDESALPAGLRNSQTIFEPRLQKKLGVGGFRLPPVVSESEVQSSSCLRGVRFPIWLQCPQCNRLKRVERWARDPGDPGCYCGECTASAPGRHRVYVIPVRFIVACEHGHIDEFPWDHWVGHSPDCKRLKPLKLTTEGAGLAGLILTCTECGKRRSMERIFQKGALTGLTCSGRRPWLKGPNENCNKTPRALQRGASNLYYPVVHSVLDIPPWSDSLQKMLGQYWHSFVSMSDPTVENLKIQANFLMPILGNIGLDAEQIAARIFHRLRLITDFDSDNIKRDEYEQLTNAPDLTSEEDSEFEIRQESIPMGLTPYLEQIVRVVRMREVRAMSGFTRILPPDVVDNNSDVRISPIRLHNSNWLPAVEVRGEGIFITLNIQYLATWEELPMVVERAAQINNSFVEAWQQRVGLDGLPDRKITPRFLLIHSLAHSLMRQLALECGYDSSSLCERLYVEDGVTGMCGLLIYTATQDADGTLGGLVRQGQPHRLEELIVNGLFSMKWCSSDPLCIQGLASVSEAFNLAACHSCLLAPETACEEYNRFLDRAMLIGLPEDPRVGFFEPLIRRV
ncbi:MAG: DUF1998 domain-containing protein [Chlorobiaceae bacterium]|nr:DUF1998 domain-containing protein [Chlorobiaceae bacterium]